MAEAKQAALSEARTAEAVPSRPALAPGVALAGEMPASGFAQRQWLAQRNGQFVQVTELLYRLLEALDGKRTLPEIAEHMSKNTGRAVSADNVRLLLTRKLIPMGLVPAADGTVAATSEGSRSPLRINMRTTVITPAVIEPITGVLSWLFLPPVIAIIVLLTLVTQIWLFFVHGVAQAVHQSLYTPGLLLVVLTLVILSAAFHEFGHAAALRYGGGHVRRMGVGIYLMYPAFFTDVTENYRLGRWGKLRTDLGGFYFNLIFALAMIGLYTLTRQEFLLLLVPVTDLDIIRQSLPFVRLDGYWALADLTGLPDFFSQILPFLRTALPLSWWKDGRRLPALKPWVKAVFATYIAVTVPLLLLLLFLTVRAAPRVLATDVDSLHRQGQNVVLALGRGNALGVVAGLVQGFVLLLSTLAIIYLLGKLATGGTRALWRWSKPTPRRRLAGTAIAAGAIAALYLLWAPEIPGTSTPGPLFSPNALQPIGARERGTLGDLFAMSSTGPPKPSAGGAGSPAGESEQGSWLRHVPVIGGLVGAVASALGSGGHGSFVDTIRSVPVVGGIVGAVVPAPHTAPGPQPSSVVGTGGGSSGAGGQARNGATGSWGPSTSGGTRGVGNARTGPGGSVRGTASAVGIGLTVSPGAVATPGAGATVGAGATINGTASLSVTPGIGAGATVQVGLTAGVVVTAGVGATVGVGTPLPTLSTAAVGTVAGLATTAPGATTPLATLTGGLGQGTPPALGTSVSGGVQGNPQPIPTTVP